jgi:predicted polyphosphate/ATP-dependent NAD kinase
MGASMVSVAVIANPASGRDIRRLVAGASVFDNAEKGSMVHRLLAGLGATGVERVLMMPAGEGLSSSLLRHLRGRTGALAAQAVPALEFLDIRLRGDARDSAAAVEAALREQVTAIVVLGGDGTHRIVAKHAGDVPLCTLSTGTNNAFPEFREATVAGEVLPGPRPVQRVSKVLDHRRLARTTPPDNRRRPSAGRPSRNEARRLCASQADAGS